MKKCAECTCSLSGKLQTGDKRLESGKKKPVISSSNNFVLVQADMESQQVVKDGKTAYAFRQASICNQMVAHIVTEWKDLPSKLLHMENGDACI